jgi:hypothetical protein
VVPVGVVTSLEASSLETPFARRHGCMLIVVASASGDESVVGKGKKGVVYLTPRRLPSCWWLGVFTRLLFGCLQRSAASDVARQPLVRCGTALKGQCFHQRQPTRIWHVKRRCRRHLRSSKFEGSDWCEGKAT